MADETLLEGGFTNAGRVTRVGDTVRRPARPTTPATKALLDHLERAGFDGAPRFLGIDDRGREVLSYVPGEAAVEPIPEWAFRDKALVSVAELLRRYHAAAASFDATRHAWPLALPAGFRGSIVCHNDPNSTMSSSPAAVPSPSSISIWRVRARVAWDVACAARLWVPLRDARDVPDGLRGRTLARLRMFVDAYGMSAGDRGRVVDAMVHAHDWCYRVVMAAVAAGHESFGEMWHAGGASRAQRTRKWLANHDDEMRTALDVTR